MPDKRKHRGSAPRDSQLFANNQQALLAQAAAHLAWLLERGYAEDASLKLVGDRFTLRARQRTAIRRVTDPADKIAARSLKALRPEQLQGRELAIDGFNILTTAEAALSGGVLLLSRDGCVRDMASMHGSYRKVQETEPALQWIGETLETLGVRRCHWYLDKPVSNSGRLKVIMRELAESRGWDWHIELVPDPDELLKSCEPVVLSADRIILDHCAAWFNLGAHLVEKSDSPFWLLDLSGGCTGIEEPDGHA